MKKLSKIPLKAIWCLTFLFFSVTISAQGGFNNHWHFGAAIGVDFSSGSPTSSSSTIETAINAEPAVLSDAFGNLLAYADGTTVYNSLGAVIDNGDFEAPSFENIFAPIPGEMDKFYLFRSSASLGVTWTIIDLSAMGGAGAILDTEKDIEFHVGDSQLMVTSHANQTDFWLVIGENENGSSGGELNLTSYSITNSGLNMAATFSGSYSWATFDPYIDDARISPDCSRITTIHKGHYSTLYEFDNANGVIVSGFANSADVQSSFGTEDYIEFSQSGDYLYVLRDNQTIVRYDATLLNEIDYAASQMSIDVPPNANWNHIKRGPDGNIYLMNSSENGLDVILNSEDDDPVIETGVLELEGENGNFFPNTMNSCQGSIGINVTNVCITDSTYFIASINVDPDSLYWTVNGDGVTDTIFSISNFSEYYDDPNEFAITFNYLFEDIWYMLEDSAIVYAQPTVDLGEDIVTCQGEIVELSVGETPYDLMWNTSSTDYAITVENTGFYSVTIVNGACDVFDDIVVTFIQEPTVNVDDIVICDEQVDVTMDAEGPWIDNWIWQDGSTDTTLTVAETGTYSVTVSNQCFTDQDTALVTYVFFPESLIDDEFTLCGVVDSLFLESSYLEGNIMWSTGDTGPYATITEDGSYNIQVEQLGCFTFDSFDVLQIPYVDVNDLVIPNVITVNGDQVNDTFRPFAYYDKLENICEYETLSSEMQIFNRWGNKLYTGGCSWDAQYDDNNESNEGTFYYIIDASSQCKDLNSVNQFTGTVQVLK